jgi:peptidyl-prolyl cis-trans isomerase C
MQVADVKRVRRAVLTAVLGCVVLAGCDKKPEGQVIATVNGDEITQRELVAEVNAVGGGANVSEQQMKSAQPLLVQGMVDRKLLVQEAKRSNLDKNPQYLALRQRTDDILLAQMLAQSWAARDQKPAPAAVQAFINENPLMFGQRQAVLVDAIVTPATSITPKQLLPFQSNDAIAAWLRDNKKPFERGNRQIDTMTLPRPFAQQLLARAAKGEPVALNDGNALTIMAARAVRPAPVPANQWRPLAERAMKQQAQGKVAQDEIKRLRETADISYLPGYAPKGKADAAAPAAPK